MKSFLSLIVTAVFFAGAASLVGCQSNDQSKTPPEDRGSTAGGNGAFGENPSRPGAYSGDRYSTPATQPSNNTP
jgi:hypothetical protein